MRFQLIARVNDEQLFTKCTHELGTLFYTLNTQNIVERVAYFSGSRLVLFKIPNQVSKELANRIKAEGFKVDRLEVDENQGYVKIMQGGSEQ